MVETLPVSPKTPSNFVILSSSVNKSYTPLSAFDTVTSVINETRICRNEWNTSVARVSPFQQECLDFQHDVSRIVDTGV